jgi:hypothetical protein
VCIQTLNLFPSVDEKFKGNTTARKSKHIYTYVANQRMHIGKICFKIPRILVLCITYKFRSPPRPSSGCYTSILIKYKPVRNILIPKQLFMVLKSVNNIRINKLAMSVAFLTARQVQLHCRVYITLRYPVALQDLV